MKNLIWLDDTRNPNENDWLVFSPIENPYQVHWLKTYQEFTEWIEKNGMPDGVCFDHDLSDFQAWMASYPEEFEDAYKTGIELGKQAEWDEKLAQEKTGYDCAKWLVERCLDGHGLLPKWNIQSSNPAGKENINSYLSNFRKHHAELCS